MRELDKTKVYSLEDLTSDELQNIYKIVFEPTRRYKSLEFSDGSWVFNNSKDKNRTNAKELFYTLENIQVDCRRLTREQIKEMADVFESNGYINSIGLNVYDIYFVLRQKWNKEDRNFGILGDHKDDRFITITYEKFMELFGRKEENFKKLVEVLNEELTEEAYKETEYEVKYIAEKPKQYNIGIDTFNPQPHYNNENGSLYKIANDLGLNHWEFDIFKRLVRCRRKNQFKEDLQKIKDTIDIYLNEFTDEK